MCGGSCVARALIRVPSHDPRPRVDGQVWGRTARVSAAVWLGGVVRDSRGAEWARTTSKAHGGGPAFRRLVLGDPRCELFPQTAAAPATAPFVVRCASLARLTEYQSAVLSRYDKVRNAFCHSHGCIYAPSARVKVAAGRPSHRTIRIAGTRPGEYRKRARPVTWPTLQRTSRATCCHVIPRSRRRASRAACNATESHRSIRSGPTCGRVASATSTSEPGTKLSGVRPSQSNIPTAWFALIERLSRMPVRVDGLSG